MRRRTRRIGKVQVRVSAVKRWIPSIMHLVGSGARKAQQKKQEEGERIPPYWGGRCLHCGRLDRETNPSILSFIYKKLAEVLRKCRHQGGGKVRSLIPSSKNLFRAPERKGIFESAVEKRDQIYRKAQRGKE